jgi:hypothetical protein
VPGSHHPRCIDVVRREHALVETGGVRTANAMGLRALPLKSWRVNCGWVIAANIASDLAAWRHPMFGWSQAEPPGREQAKRSQPSTPS